MAAAVRVELSGCTESWRRIRCERGGTWIRTEGRIRTCTEGTREAWSLRRCEGGERFVGDASLLRDEITADPNAVVGEKKEVLLELVEHLEMVDTGEKCRA